MLTAGGSPPASAAALLLPTPSRPPPPNLVPAVSRARTRAARVTSPPAA
jgi:hypothetical protein